MYVKLHLTGLFNQNLSRLASPKFCNIHSSCLKLIQKHIAHLKENLDTLKASKCSAHITSTHDDDAVEALNLEATNAMLILAGKACTQKARFPVSPPLHKAQTMQRIVQQLISQFKTHRDMWEQIECKQIQLKTPLELPTLLPAASPQSFLSSLPVKRKHQTKKVEALVNSECIGST
jgi:hypothetical protein